MISLTKSSLGNGDGDDLADLDFATGGTGLLPYGMTGVVLIVLSGEGTDGTVTCSVDAMAENGVCAVTLSGDAALGGGKGTTVEK